MRVLTTTLLFILVAYCAALLSGCDRSALPAAGLSALTRPLPVNPVNLDVERDSNLAVALNDLSVRMNESYDLLDQRNRSLTQDLNELKEANSKLTEKFEKLNAAFAKTSVSRRVASVKSSSKAVVKVKAGKLCRKQC